MYYQFRCKACDREEYAFKTVLLEDNNRACAGCYFTALEKGAPSLMTIEDVRETHIQEETVITTRNKYLNTLKKYSIKYGKPPLQVMEDFINIEISLAKEHLGVDRKQLTGVNLHKFTLFLKNIVIPKYFGNTLTAGELKSITTTGYYSHKDYEDKLRNWTK